MYKLRIIKCLKMEKRSPEEEAEFAAESLWEPDWKKMLVDSNAVILMSGRSSLLKTWRENQMAMVFFACR